MKHKAIGAALVLLAGSMSCDRSVSLPTTGSINVVIVSESGNLLSVSAPGSADVEQRDGGLANVLLDGARLTVTGTSSGTTSKTVTVTQATGTDFVLVADQLPAGSYNVRVEGLVAGEVAHYGETTGITVTAGQQTTAPMTLPPFLATTGVVVPDTSDVLRFTVNYSAIQNATGYIVQWSKSPTMTNASSKNVSGTSTDVTVTDEGNYYVTVRATNAAVPGGGKASAAATVHVFQGVASVAVSPPSPAIAYGGTQQFSAEARDADNNVVPNVTWFWASSNHTVATVSQSGLVTAVGGGSATITAVGKGTPGNASLTVSPPPATKLAFTAQPTTTVAGATMTAIKVAVQNDLGQTATSDNSTQVTLALGANPGGGTLSGGGTVTVTAGVATFNFVSINKTGTGYTFAATGGSLTAATSAAFTIAPGAPSALAFSVQPPNGVLGDALSPAVQVEIRDANGNVVTSARDAITMAIGTNPSGATLGGATTVNAVGGIASFSNLNVNKGGTGYTLSATSGTLTAAASGAFNIASSGPAAQIVFTAQPSNATSQQSIAPAIKVALRDAQGRTVADDNATQITVAIGTNAGAGTLTGTATATVAAGVATFSDLKINKSGSGYTLTADAASLPQASSSAFNIQHGAAATVAFVVQPMNTVAGDAMSPAVQVEVRDAAGNRVASARDAVTIGIGTNPSIGGTGALTGTKVVNAIDGIASFTGLWINKTGNGYTFAASASGLTGTTSGGFNVTPAAAAKLSFSQQPSNVQGNAAIAPAISVTITDQFDNATTATNAVTLGIANNPWKTVFSTGASLSGTQTVAAVNGVATFNNLRIDKPSPGYALGASSGALASATSSDFNVNLNVTQISTGNGSHSCLTTANGPYCFGYNGNGQLGALTGNTFSDSVAALVRGGLVFTQITVGGSHSCGLTAAGAAYCWGYNAYGQLGDNTQVDKSQPVAVAGNHVFASIDAGNIHTCGITTASATAAEDRQVYCWGYNGNGQIGDGTAFPMATQRYLVPFRVVEPLRTTTRATQVSAGSSHTCVRALDTNAYCWGYNYYGQLGDGAILSSGGNGAPRSAPFAVVGGYNWVSISAGNVHTCGVTFVHAASQPVVCVGYNGNGQLGNGNNTNTSSPVVASSLLWVAASAGNGHSCAILSGGSAYCWGYNGEGQLGDDSQTTINIPVAVSGGLQFQAIEAGGNQTCGRTTAAAYCWGANWNGQLGSPGTNGFKKTPTQIVQ